MPNEEQPAVVSMPLDFLAKSHSVVVNLVATTMDLTKRIEQLEGYVAKLEAVLSDYAKEENAAVDGEPEEEVG